MKILIYCDTGWSLGQLYSAVAPHVGADFAGWAKSYDREFFAKYDRVLTLAGPGSRCLVGSYGVSRGKILIVAHAEQDLIQLIEGEKPLLGLKKDDHGPNVDRVVNLAISEYAGFGVVSDSLACSSLALGITRVPTVLRQGICCATYACKPAERLRTVGYAAVMSRCNAYGVEIKRGELVRRVVEGMGLRFEPAMTRGELTREQMPGYYQSVDAVVCSSLQEGGAMPPYEAAAAGRLVVGTPVGDFPRLALEGLGVMGPLNDEPFVRFLEKILKFYRSNRREFQLKCLAIQEAAQGRDWPAVVDDWVHFVKKS